MADDLSPFFESRETRVSRLPQEARGGFEQAQQAALTNGQTDFGDRQFVSLWLSRRTGLPRKEVLANFDGINKRFFGDGSTAATAYDAIAKEYAPPKPEDESKAPVGAKTQEEDYHATTGLPQAGKQGFLYYAGQSGRQFMAGYTGTAQQVPAGIFSQIATLESPTLEDATKSDEYLALKRHNETLTQPIQATMAVYDEPMSFGPTISTEDEARVSANESKMQALVATADAKNRETMKAFMDSPAGKKQQANRGISNFWYDLSKNAAERFKVDPKFADTALGSFVGSAGSVPATAALALLGPEGWIGMEGQFFADVESERMQAQGKGYDPKQAFAANLGSAVPQMILERAFGVERLLGEAAEEVPKFARKVRFGDFARTFFKKALEGGAEEGITEPTQGAWNDYMASLSYDDKREVLTGEGAKRRLIESTSAFALGALFGGGVASVSLADEVRNHKEAPEAVVSKDNLPMTEADFRALGEAKTDEQIKALAKDEESGRVLVAAARGDVEAQTVFNSKVVAESMIDTKGTSVAGMELSEVNGVPVVKMEDGFSMPLDLSNEEERNFFQNAKQAAAEAAQITDNVTVPEPKEEPAAQPAEEGAQPAPVEEEKPLTEEEQQGLADKAIKALEKLKIHQLDNVASATPISIAWDGAIETAILAIKAGKLATEVVQSAIDHFREKYGQEDADTEQKLTAAIQGILPKPKVMAKHGASMPSISSPPISAATVTHGVTGVAQNAQQALQAQAQRIRAKKLAASQSFQARQALGTIPQQSKAVRKSTEASIAAKLLVPVNSRLAAISADLGQRLRKFEFSIGKAIAKDFAAVKPLLLGFEAMPKADAELLDYALKNGDAITRDRLLNQHNLASEYKAATKVIEAVRKRAISAGYEVGQVDEYFPRKVKDLDGLMAHYYGHPVYGVVEQAIADAEKKANSAGLTLTPDDRMEIVNATLQRARMGNGAPSNTKARTTDIVSVDANQFYASSTEALVSYVERMNEAIEKRKFFGRYAIQNTARPGVSSQITLEASIGSYVENLVARGEMNRTQQREAVSILEARFSGGVMADSVKLFKTLSYMSTMGQLTSSVAQVTDLSFSLYESGFFNTLVAAGQAVSGKSKITREALGLDAIAEEFRDPGKLAKILNGVFKAVGIHYLDAIGKETLVNSKFRSMAKEAASGRFSPKTQALLNASFTPQERAQVSADLAAGKQTEDTLFLAYSVLADYQPINRSEYPEYYLRHPNGRIFYMLKNFTLKQIDAFRREGITKIVNGSAKQKVEGFRNLAHLGGLLFLAGVGTDWLKDWVMQRDPKLGDLAVDNLLKLVAINRWSLYQFRERKNLVESAMSLALPPAPFLTYPAQDIMKAVDQIQKGDEVKPGEFESWRILPFGGAAYYWWAGGGKTKIEKKRDKEANPPSHRR